MMGELTSAPERWIGQPISHKSGAVCDAARLVSWGALEVAGAVFVTG